MTTHTTLTPPTDRKKADAWMLQGIRQHEEFNHHFKTAREKAIVSGFFFIRARAALGQGDWGTFLAGYTHKIKERTVYRHIVLAEAALEWAKTDRPDLTGDKLEKHAATMQMQSPRQLIELGRVRDIDGSSHFLPFGEYDSVAYNARKRLANGEQLELKFEQAFSFLDLLGHLGESNCTLVLPEGKSEREALEQLDAQLSTIHAKVRAQLNEAT